MSSAIRVLLVEDSDDDAQLLLRELRRAGYAPETRRVESADEMRRVLSDGRWDVVICDYALPGFGAPQALELLRNSGADTPFIMVSGVVDEQLAVDALKAGAGDFVAKSRLGRLAIAVGRELREAASRRERALDREAMREQDERFRLLAGATSDALWDVDLRAGTAWVGRGYDVLFGYPASSVVDIEDWKRNIHPEDTAAVEETLASALRDGAESWSMEYRFRRADGTYAHVFDRRFVARDASGRATRLVGGMVDVSERKRLEEQLRQSQKMEAVGLLAGGIAHDFNNLLAIITSSAELAAEELRPGDPMLEDLNDIRQAAERAAALTRQLLAFGRRQVFRPVVLDLNAVVREFEKMLKRVIGADVEFVARLEPQLGKARADAGQIEQVLMNLVLNARDAMPQGGRLVVETSSSDPAEPGRFVQLAVSDTGAGMDEATRARIFEPFFTTKPAGRGTGLGLSTVYGIVRQSGGEIHVESAPGRGSTFRVRLPRVDDSCAPAPASPPAAPAPRRASETVLLVDDDPGVRSVATRVLNAAGYRTLAAASGEAAIALAAQHEGPVDLLVTDVMMPGTRGPDLAADLRGLRPECGVLFMSGYFGGSASDRAALPEDAPLLAKPFTPRSLLEAVRAALEARRHEPIALGRPGGR